MLRGLALAAGLVVLAGCSKDQDTRTYRVPSSSMEPTLHCARPGIGCEAAQMDLVAAHPYASRQPTRGDLVVFRTPAVAQLKCGSGGVFIQRLIGLPGEPCAGRPGYIYVDG